MKFKRLTTDANNKDGFFVQKAGNPEILKGIPVVINRIEISEDNKDLRIGFNIGTELRIFGENLLPSYGPSEYLS